MVSKWIERMKVVGQSTIAIPAEAQADPIGAKLDWSPIESGGTNIRTHRLVIENPQTAVFVPTALAKAFYSLFMAIGLGLSGTMIYNHTVNQAWSFNMITLVPILIGLIFAAFGGYMFFFGTRPCTFDKRAGYFWKGQTRPTDHFNPDELEDVARLEEIHALQLIREYIPGDRQSRGYYSYELNLVLTSGDRVNIVDHGNLRKLRADAEKLAEFLEKPLWAAV